MPQSTTAEAFAPAKVNLSLHVTGQRADGYHLLDSLVVFAGIGDHLNARAAPRTSLRVTGPMQGTVPDGGDNLVLRAAALFDPPVGAEITLTKNLPAAAGLGGGSSDAAACLSALSGLSGRPLPPRAAQLTLGADVPACVVGVPLRMQGIGERLTAWPPLPPLWLVLVNPGVGVSTPEVFRGLDSRDNAPMPDMPHARSAADFLHWLRAQRNDMQSAACRIAPEIGGVLAAIAETPGCQLARMSGSGATCFGLYTSPDSAGQAALRIARAQPRWWCQAGAILD
ncbi:4-(cytidine 5'-diphospho)-2-C-methyl-D-erythritol kinase [Meridianimarinicoccus roseus]|uniref:4-diphosphocytidyl-2-C-methyl-D-erythritol kinase n=1 Tax=Meridianimarinicoccus roseus TaxID=2072018 RepID=A0A2V2L8R8_9RHOB|nr:4-(cytidine 5'-diphospho)-2-C-methyl-D-erythritol kinase [Meridianimarinicoccus roseus]PWR01682.1 4-(cytidine 5'-diphospho)-2-C-methyl-D-erythritol kinase [Meridianimarinicoccus roseus]